jgi:uncharacterized protein (UPF0264 family)
MTKLLVSVQDVEEAKAAWHAGADVIDVKNPAVGSLGAAEPETVLAISQCLAEAPMTVALGDLPLWPGTIAYAVRGALSLSPRIRVKVGLQGPYLREAVQQVFQVLGRVQPQRVIPAIYLDQLVSIDELDMLCQLASAAGHQGIVWDTLSKATSWYEWLSWADLGERTQMSHQRGLWVGLAGHFVVDQIPGAVQAGVDIIGVRSAVAAGGLRQGRLDGLRVRAFKQQLELLSHSEADVRVPPS